MTFYVGEQTIKARPGSFLFGPKDIPHAFSVDSGPARLLFILSPAGMEGLIREMGEPARELSIPPPPEEPPDEAEMGRLMAIAAKYGGGDAGTPTESVGALRQQEGGLGLPRRTRPSCYPYSPECVEGKCSEVQGLALRGSKHGCA
jgi:hypothetical protein